MQVEGGGAVREYVLWDPAAGMAWVEGAKWSYEPKDGRRFRSWKEASEWIASVVVFRNCSIMEVSCS